MAAKHRARATLNVDRNNTTSVTGRAKGMASGFAAHPALFNTPEPGIKDLEDQTTAVDKAEVVAGTRAKGAAAARNVERSKLVGLLETGRAYIQGRADESGTYEDAVATIEAGGLKVAGAPKRSKPILAVKQGPEAGTVAIIANAGLLTAGHKWKKTFFNWQYSVDGKTFINLPSTPKARTTLGNLTPLSTYAFRVSVTNPDGIAGPWSQVVSFLVH